MESYNGWNSNIGGGMSMDDPTFAQHFSQMMEMAHHPPGIPPMDHIENPQIQFEILPLEEPLVILNKKMELSIQCSLIFLKAPIKVFRCYQEYTGQIQEKPVLPQEEASKTADTFQVVFTEREKTRKRGHSQSKGHFVPSDKFTILINFATTNGNFQGAKNPSKASLSPHMIRVEISGISQNSPPFICASHSSVRPNCEASLITYKLAKEELNGVIEWSCLKEEIKKKFRPHLEVELYRNHKPRIDVCMENLCNFLKTFVSSELIQVREVHKFWKNYCFSFHQILSKLEMEWLHFILWMIDSNSAERELRNQMKLLGSTSKGLCIIHVLLEEEEGPSLVISFIDPKDMQIKHTRRTITLDSSTDSLVFKSQHPKGRQDVAFLSIEQYVNHSPKFIQVMKSDKSIYTKEELWKKANLSSRSRWERILVFFQCEYGNVNFEFFTNLVVQ